SRQRRRLVGELAPAFLVVADAVRDKLDGRDELRRLAGRGVRRRPSARRFRILDSRACADQGARRRLAPGPGARPRPQGQPVAVPTAFLAPRIAWALYLLVAVMWLIPDRRIEAVWESEKRHPPS